MRRSSVRIWMRSCSSSADSGSSSSRTRGSVIAARASATRCCWPPESWPGRRSASSVRRTFSIISSAALPRSADDMPRTRSAKAMLSRTLRCGNSAYDWNIIAVRRSTGGEPDHILAADQDLAVGRIFVAGDHPRIVVLPQPEGPRKQQ